MDANLDRTPLLCAKWIQWVACRCGRTRDVCGHRSTLGLGGRAQNKLGIDTPHHGTTYPLGLECDLHKVLLCVLSHHQTHVAARECTHVRESAYLVPHLPQLLRVLVDLLAGHLCCAQSRSIQRACEYASTQTLKAMVSYGSAATSMYCQFLSGASTFCMGWDQLGRIS